MLGKKPDRGMFKRNERNRKLLIWKIVKEFFFGKVEAKEDGIGWWKWTQYNVDFFFILKR